MHPLSRSSTFLLAAVLALPAGARADHAAPPVGAQAPARAPDHRPPERQSGSLPGRAAADELLDAARGGSEVTKIDTRLTGSVGGNSASNVTTGANVIQNGSFANMSGIPIVVQNTGANVLIQNATVINLQFN